ncbi:hypothetical protein GCM10009806_02760 [Microbacterium flavum]
MIGNVHAHGTQPTASGPSVPAGVGADEILCGACPTVSRRGSLSPGIAGAESIEEGDVTGDGDLADLAKPRAVGGV